MGFSTDYIVGFYRKRAAEMAALYDQRKTSGERRTIPFPEHKAVRVLVNHPRKPLDCSNGIPVYINLHGGAFAEGSAVLMDSFCQNVADALGIVVVNLDYRLFPEVYYPYPVEELNTVYDWLCGLTGPERIDTSRICVGGFSAGATIALGSATELIRHGRRGYCCVVGCYPMTSGRKEDVDSSSPYAATEGELSAAMDLSMGEYTDKPICSPLLEEDEYIRQIKSAVMITCGRDSLGEMGRRYVQRLKDNGVPLLYKEYPDALHGFVEVNQPDYFFPDERKSADQRQMAESAEQFIISGLKKKLN